MGRDLFGEFDEIDKEAEGGKKLDKLGSAGRRGGRKPVVYSEKPVHAGPGFYYAFDRKPDSLLNEGAYEVIGSLNYSECDMPMVGFRPLFSSQPEAAQNSFQAMPLPKFTCMVMGPGGSRMQRFRLITDDKVILELRKIRNQMYPPPSHRLEMDPPEELMQHLRQIASTGILGKTTSEVALKLFQEHFDLVSIHARLSRLD